MPTVVAISISTSSAPCSWQSEVMRTCWVHKLSFQELIGLIY